MKGRISLLQRVIVYGIPSRIEWMIYVGMPRVEQVVGAKKMVVKKGDFWGGLRGLGE